MPVLATITRVRPDLRRGAVTEPEAPPAIERRGVAQRFGAVRANDGVDPAGSCAAPGGREMDRAGPA